jgi:hypothetical protein
MMNCLSNRAEIVVPETPAVPAPAKLPIPGVVPLVHAGLVDAVEGKVVGETVGIIGASGDGPTGLTVGNTLGSGTGGVEPTPRLAISNDPNGIPVRAPPPGVVGEVDVGADDAARLLEPEPHVPDIPDVSSVPGDPEDIGISDVTVVVDDVDAPDVVVVPEFTAVAGAAVPTAIPPPSKLAVEPNISKGEVATVEHVVLLVVVGIVIVPVTPVGAGLTPGDVISVEPIGIPVGEPAEPVATPSGEVAPIMGVGVAVPSNCPSTCAMAALQATSAARTAAISETLIGALRLQTALPHRAPCRSILRRVRLVRGCRTSVNPSVAAHEASEKSAATDVQFFVQRPVQLPLLCVEFRKPSLLGSVRWRTWIEIFGSRLNVNGRRCGSSRRRSCFEGAGLGSDAA